MGKFLAGLVGWWQGNKTILGGALVAAGAVAGVWYGKLDPATALTVVGIGLSIAGFGAKANRHHAELLTALQGIAQVGVDVKAGNKSAALQSAEQTAYTVGLAMQPGALAAAGASLHLSATTAAELADVLQALMPPANVTHIHNAGATAQ